MFRLADEIASMPERYQRCFALCIVERVLVAKSLFADGEENSLVNELAPIVDELWLMVSDNDVLAADAYERLREQINECRLPSHNDNQQFRFRDVCWIVKSVLKVFRGSEHSFEISRLGDAMASISISQHKY